MGSCSCKTIINKNKNRNIFPNSKDYKISTFNFKQGNSSMSKFLIDKLVGYYIENKIDILAINGVKEYAILEKIEKKFKEKVNRLYFAPLIRSRDSDITLVSLWSGTEIVDNDNNLDCILISKHPILNIIRKEIDYNSYKRNIVVSNIDLNGIILSVYNTALPEDGSGVSRRESRKKHINIINDFISSNHDYLKKKNYYKKYETIIEFMCASLSINDYMGSRTNQEYIDTIRSLEGIDCYKFVKELLGNNKSESCDATAMSGLRHSYNILLTKDLSIMEPKSNKELANYLYHKNILLRYCRNIQLEYFSDFILETGFTVINKKYLQKPNSVEEIVIEL